MLYWFLLALSIVFEIAATTCLKLSDGLRHIWPTVGVFVFYGICFVFLIFAIRKIDISVAYAIWSGVGVAATVVIGYFLFQEPLTTAKLIFTGLILIGVVGLKLITPSH